MASHREKVKKLRVDHHCQLPTQEEIIVRYIDTGWFVYMRRRIKSWMMVNPNHPYSKAFLKSDAAIAREKARHLQLHYYMIHPFSKARTTWEFIMMFVLIFVLIIIPIEITLSRTVCFVAAIRLLLDLFCCVDIFIAFFTGYYNPNTQKIILNRRKVAKRYFFGYFIIDLISSVPAYFILSLTTYTTNEIGLTFQLMSCLKFLRITTLVKYLDDYRDTRDISIYKFKFFKLMLVFLILVLWATSITCMMAYKSEHTWLPSDMEDSVYGCLIFSLFKVCSMFYNIGYSSQPSKYLFDMICEIIGLQIGVIIKLYLLAQANQILKKYDSSGNKFQQLIKQLHEYVRYKELPVSMKHRIERYFDFRFQKHFYKETEIISNISPQLRQEIVLHRCRRFVEKVPFFRDLPFSLLVTIVHCLKDQVFLPNDVIVHGGTIGDSMYFISFGTVAIYTNDGKELCHLSDGSCFGEIALILEDEKRVASVVAVNACELFNLSRADFRKAIQPYPECFLRMKKIAQDRMQKTQAFVAKTSMHTRGEESEVSIARYV